MAKTVKKSKSNAFWKVGKNYFIRTVTHYQAGKLVAVTDQEVVLESASWVADTGRFTGALESGNFSEVEMFPKGSRVLVGRGAIVDAVELAAPLPARQK